MVEFNILKLKFREFRGLQSQLKSTVGNSYRPTLCRLLYIKKMVRIAKMRMCWTKKDEGIPVSNHLHSYFINIFSYHFIYIILYYHRLAIVSHNS